MAPLEADVELLNAVVVVTADAVVDAEEVSLLEVAEEAVVLERTPVVPCPPFANRAY
jgi:hypothetical protein